MCQEKLVPASAHADQRDEETRDLRFKEIGIGAVVAAAHFRSRGKQLRKPDLSGVTATD